MITPIYQSGKQFTVPSYISPVPHQMTSTVGDNLCEFAGRVCYDSFRNVNSRPSVEYHGNLNAQKHASVWRHFNFTVQFHDLKLGDLYLIGLSCANKPGVSYSLLEGDRKARVTINLNAVKDWDNEPCRVSMIGLTRVKDYLGYILKGVAHELAPLVMSDCPLPHSEMGYDELAWKYQLSSPVNDHETWVSYHIKGVSRSLSMELNRHLHNAAVSQRSTRYVDEGSSKLILHPAVRNITGWEKDSEAFQQDCLDLYRDVFEGIQCYLLDQGMDKANAKKQARGAARQYLPNGIETDLVFSANLSQWKHILLMRGTPGADMEIMEFAGEVFESLSSMYVESFKDWNIDEGVICDRGL